MKFTVTQPVEIDVSLVRIDVPVRYEEEDIPNDFPLRDGDMWKAIVAINNGQIQGWPQGRAGEMHMKVCDGGEYSLLNHAGEQVGETLSDYVPGGLIPEGGDYIVLSIDANGYITNWPKRPDVSAFFGDED